MKTPSSEYKAEYRIYTHETYILEVLLRCPEQKSDSSDRQTDGAFSQLGILKTKPLGHVDEVEGGVEEGVEKV